MRVKRYQVKRSSRAKKEGESEKRILLRRFSPFLALLVFLPNITCVVTDLKYVGPSDCRSILKQLGLYSSVDTHSSSTNVNYTSESREYIVNKVVSPIVRRQEPFV